MNVTLGEIIINLQKPDFSPGISVFHITLKNDLQFSCYLDERDNTFNPHFPPQTMFSDNDEVWNIGSFLIMCFSKFKQSDFRYGTSDDKQSPYYEPTRKILGEDFLLYLQSEYRDNLIINLLK